MASVLHTTTEQIRAVFGLNAETELEDALITNLDLATLILLELDVVYSTHEAAIAAGAASGATAAQLKLAATIKLFCAYQGAVFLLPGLQNFIAQKVSDGDAEMQRFQKDDLEKTIGRITAMRDYLKENLNPTLYDSDALYFEPMAVTTPTFDPVTNEGA